MTESSNVDLLIAGAGMTGLALALAMSELGCRVEVVDPQALDLLQLNGLIEQKLKTDFDSRVSALTLASQQLLVNLGVWPQICRWGAEPYTRMYVWDGETRGEIDFDANEVHQPYLGHIVENRWIQFALLQAAAKDPGIRLTPGVKIERFLEFRSEGGSVQLSDGSQRLAKLVIGADGAESQTRKLAGLGTHEWDYGHHAVVATLRTEKSHQDCCWQCFTADGPLALLPLADPDKRALSLVWSTSADHARQLVSMDESEFCAAITDGSRSILGAVQSASQVQSIRLKQRHAQSYVTQGLALIGDAAHTIHPLAGQGVNLGFQDVGALVDQLQDALARNESIGDIRVLRRYQRARRFRNVKMTAMMEGFKRLFEPQPPLVEMGRSIGMRLVGHSGPVKQHLMHEAMGLADQSSSLLKVDTDSLN